MCGRLFISVSVFAEPMKVATPGVCRLKLCDHGKRHQVAELSDRPSVYVPLNLGDAGVQRTQLAMKPPILALAAGDHGELRAPGQSGKSGHVVPKLARCHA
jgi:hypothetical protein